MNYVWETVKREPQEVRDAYFAYCELNDAVRPAYLAYYIAKDTYQDMAIVTDLYYAYVSACDAADMAFIVFMHEHDKRR